LTPTSKDGADSNLLHNPCTDEDEHKYGADVALSRSFAIVAARDFAKPIEDGSNDEPEDEGPSVITSFSES
jgi:hypothetical protein